VEVASQGAPVKLAGTTMSACVCGHGDVVHGSAGCLKAFLGCNCPEFQADDGSDGAPAGTTYYGSNVHNKYTGIYRGPYSLTEETA